jgi:K+-sensing histidine kinase KdpD
MLRWGPYIFGTGLCISAALIATTGFRGTQLAGVLPWFFVVIVAVVAVRFGIGAGISGTLAAAVIFAEFLFQPFMSIRVADTVERNALIWMVLGGFMSSELLGERSNDSNRSTPRGAPRT